jgi:hypothetical protein
MIKYILAAVLLVASVQASSPFLAPAGSATCPSGTVASQEECEAFVATLVSPNSAGREMQVGSGGTCGDEAWGQAPLGCSAQTGGDYTAHYKTDGDVAAECISSDYQLVCVPDLGPTETCPPTEGSFGFIIDGYTYEIDLHGSVTQYSHETAEQWDLGTYDAGTDSYTGGTSCPNGVDRSTTITFTCGYPVTVTNVQEPSMCVYVFTATSPNCCDASGDMCAKTDHNARCGPIFGQYCYHPYWPYCNEENGWCGSSVTHDTEQADATYDHDAYISDCSPSAQDPVQDVCAINPDRRCGPNHGHKYCTDRYWPYCHENNGWCGHSDAHLNAQPSKRYNFAEYLNNCPSAASDPNLQACTVKNNQKCGPLYYNEYCYDSSMPYCNEQNGWCGATEDHKNEQASTAYDYSSFVAACGSS